MIVKNKIPKISIITVALNSNKTISETINSVKRQKYQKNKIEHIVIDGGSTDVSRQVSCVCYLNDDYQGGELEFPNFKVKIKPEQGMLILFPSSFPYLHIAHPITQGIKYTLVTWLRDK